MSQTFHARRRVEFRDTDAAGIAHFSAFFDWMESTEHEFLRSLSFSVLTHDAAGTLSWPRASASCEFRGPVGFEDVIDVELSIGRLGEKSITYRFVLRHDGRLVAEGTLTAVCCRIDPPHPPRSTPIPAAIVAALRPYVCEPQSPAD